MRFNRSRFGGLAALALSLTAVFSGAVAAHATPVPADPINVTATPGTGSVTLQWALGSGGSTVTDWLIQYRIGSNSWSTPPIFLHPPTTSTVVSSLTGGVAYDFRISSGDGSNTSTGVIVSATPNAAASAPGAPSSFTVTAGDSSAALVWSAPVSNGGAAIDAYKVEYVLGAGSWVTATSSASSPYSLTGLTNGGHYAIKVTAHNSAGWGAAAALTNIIPVASAPAPQVPVTPPPAVKHVDLPKLQANTSTPATITGENLGTAKQVLIGKTEVSTTSIGDNGIKLTVPSLAPGTYDLVIKFDGGGSYTMQDAIVVPAPVVVVPVVPVVPVTTSITGFSSTATNLTTTQMKALNAAIAGAPVGASITATINALETGGTKAIASARLRAETLTAILRAQHPGSSVVVNVVKTTSVVASRALSLTVTPKA